MKNWILPLLLLCSVISYGQITITATSIDLVCNAANGASTGEIDVTATGGVPPLSYLWTTNNGQGLNPAAEDQTELGAGTYHLVVTDSNGDTAELSNTLTQPMILSILASATDLECAEESGSPNGSLQITVTGGTAPYEYHWDTGDGIGLVQGQKDQWQLGRGTYVLVITDANGCVQEDSYTLTAPETVAVTGVATDLDCNPLSGPPTGAIDITASGGIGAWGGDYTYEWTSTDGSGLDPTKEDQNGLGAGTYSLLVTDANGCTSGFQSWTLTEPAAVKITAVTSDSYCLDNGLIDLAITGGQGSSENDYTYEWGTPDGCGIHAGSSYQPTLCAGLYWVTVTDANGCTDSAEFIIYSGAGLNIETEIKDDDCQPGDAALTITVSSGTAPYSATWASSTGGNLDAGNSVIESEGGSTTFTGMEAFQEYTFTITDVNGCTQVYSYTPGVTATYELATPSLCMVSSDPITGHYHILWENPATMDFITQFNIYREGTATGAYELIGSVDVNEDNRYVDNSVDPTIQAFKYQVTASDECGLESPASNIHKTIHLVINQGLNSRINLEWDTYEGLNYDQVIIYRGTTAQNMEELITLPSTVGSFTDTDAPTGMLFYQIVLPQTIECEIGKASFSVRSNIASFGDPTGTRDLSFDVEIYPNPINNLLYIHSEEKVRATITDNNGKLFLEKTLDVGENSINTESYSVGSYLLQLTTGSEVYSQRIIKI